MSRIGREPGLLVEGLRLYRHKAWMTQAELARVAGIGKATVSLMEAGQPASRTVIRKIAEALKVAPEVLVAKDLDHAELDHPNAQSQHRIHE